MPQKILFDRGIKLLLLRTRRSSEIFPKLFLVNRGEKFDAIRTVNWICRNTKTSPGGIVFGRKAKLLFLRDNLSISDESQGIDSRLTETLMGSGNYIPRRAVPRLVLHGVAGDRMKFNELTRQWPINDKKNKPAAIPLKPFSIPFVYRKRIKSIYTGTCGRKLVTFKC